MKDKKSKRIILNFGLSFCILIFGFCIFRETNAAGLFFDAEIKELGVNQQFKVDLILDTENEEINAVEGKVIFPEELLELKEIRDGNSIISFWIERPTLNSKSSILYSGIIPGGYQETKGFVFSVVFQAKTNGSGAIEIHGAKVLLNDGKGTSANLSVSNFQFSISEETSAAPLIVETIEDTDLPEEFKPEIAQNSDMFDGKYFLVFATQDKGSGIDYYKIQETRNKRQGENWVGAESPYVLKDQKLKSYIYVKAIDRAGNERIATLSPQNPLEWYENYYIWVKIIIGIILIYAIWRILKKRFYMPVS